ncbi:hypothetical protein [Phocaeicola vulgatus]|uniref:hypothetical protein n=1 Tax=Phocaeicola vulgatus TaxID=821 RepID=UPI001C3837DC|nr:hypothetical protein [Phocaeicola vulgatus]MBV3766147.1 hypothetical protein [Phocaeicola vulgatus]MBV3770404.1 hypothetical protein [Phocaeicola vulgatus]MBV3779737.1 hypothetical protein [Phocaeicola vulgatus]MBV3788670.1 hypothetical protein [Phocaeicola vulgatus]MBV3792921.1 hypothetical protein [Phocaeicola vulgatus]
MLYVDAVKQFAVWWEPVYDPQIDEMTVGFSKMLGHGNYYETAPRISDWEEFKETINRSIVVNSKDNQKRLQEDKKRLFPIYQLKYQRKVIELDVYQ